MALHSPSPSLLVNVEQSPNVADGGLGLLVEAPVLSKLLVDSGILLPKEYKDGAWKNHLDKFPKLCFWM
eukprot:gene105-3497_t